MLAPHDLNQLLNQLRVELTGISEALLKATLYEVLTEFFNDSGCWRESITFNVITTSTVYPITPVEGQIIRLDSVRDSLNSGIPALMPNFGEITLKYAPNSAQQYTANVVKNVSLPLAKHDIPIGPDWVLPVWHLAIKAGMLGVLMNQKSKSFSDSKGAAYNLSKFRQFVGNARSQALRANTLGAQAWRFPQTFRSLSQQGGVPAAAGTERTF